MGDICSVLSVMEERGRRTQLPKIIRLDAVNNQNNDLINVLNNSNQNLTISNNKKINKKKKKTFTKTITVNKVIEKIVKM